MTRLLPGRSHQHHVLPVPEYNHHQPDESRLLSQGYSVILPPSLSFYSNESFLVINSQFLTLDAEGEMTPVFSKVIAFPLPHIQPLNGSVLTARLQTMPCYPSQGGPYYRNNETIAYGDTDNELVQTRATDENGYLVMTVSRPWAARVSDKQSVVISQSSQGIILCTNVKWREV